MLQLVGPEGTDNSCKAIKLWREGSTFHTRDFGLTGTISKWTHILHYVLMYFPILGGFFQMKKRSHYNVKHTPYTTCHLGTHNIRDPWLNSIARNVSIATVTQGTIASLEPTGSCVTILPDPGDGPC